MENVSGNWTGTISGTNTANLFAEVRQEGNALSGIARLNDPMYGIGIYNFTGTIDGKKIQLDMTPDQSGIGRNISQTIRVGGQPVTVEYTPVHYGDIVADLEVQKDHTLSGKWTSSIGSGGTVFLRNENVILAEKGRIAQELQDRAFVMMSIQRDDAEAEDVLHSIKRATGKFDIECTRVDEVHHSGKISDLILEYIKTSKYLICDISSERPNVYYELGYAHGIEREVILIAKQGSPLHFDIKDYNTIFYRNMTELESGVEARIKAIINIDQSSWSSRVTRYPTFLTDSPTTSTIPELTTAFDYLVWTASPYVVRMRDKVVEKTRCGRNDTMTPLLTAQEVREYLNISRSTLARLVAAGLPHIGSWRLKRFHKETLLRWYNENT